MGGCVGGWVVCGWTGVQAGGRAGGWVGTLETVWLVEDRGAGLEGDGREFAELWGEEAQSDCYCTAAPAPVLQLYCLQL